MNQTPAKKAPPIAPPKIAPPTAAGQLPCPSIFRCTNHEPVAIAAGSKMAATMSSGNVANEPNTKNGTHRMFGNAAANSALASSAATRPTRSWLSSTSVALLAAALWALDPNAIGFNRIAKEDTFLVFFFLLANVFWLRSQRIAETGKESPVPYYWATAISFGAMFASKYLPGYFAASIAYYHIFQAIPATRWRLGKPRFLLFFFILGTTFVLLNLPILLPGTWRMALSFASYKRIGHDSYEFMGRLYRHKLGDWLHGVPTYFYFVLIAVKLPPLTLLAFIMGLPLLFRRRFGDGRYFLFFWVAIGFLPFVFVGGKFMRYFTPVLPVVLITAAIGVQFIGQPRSSCSRPCGLRRTPLRITGSTQISSAADKRAQVTTSRRMSFTTRACAPPSQRSPAAPAPARAWPTKRPRSQPSTPAKRNALISARSRSPIRPSAPH